MIATRHPTGFRRGLVGNVRLLRKPLAEATGMTRAITIRAARQPSGLAPNVVAGTFFWATSAG